MIDIHCHILFEADDGAQDFEETMEMCRIAENDGIRIIFATPHYIVGEVENTNIDDKLSLINKELENKSMELRLLSGNEIYLSIDCCEKLEQGKCKSLNDSKYVLVELPMGDAPKYIPYALYNILVKGYVPIIAHPERNSKIVENPQLVYDYIINGSLIQINSSSLMGLYGKKVKKTAEILLQYQMVHFIATDAHSSRHKYPALSGIWNMAEKIGSIGTARRLTHTNPMAVVENKHIIIEEPIKIKAKSKTFNIFTK